MARRRRKVDKYNQVKQKVSPITYIMVGLFFFAIFFTMFMFIDTPKQKFYKTYRRGSLYVQQQGYEFELKKDHSFKKISLKNLEKEIEKGSELVVFFGTPACTNCVQAVDQIQYIYDNEKGDDNDVSKFVSTIYYVELDVVGEEQLGLEGLRDFYKKYNLKSAGSAPDLVAFKNAEAVVQYEAYKDSIITEAQKLFTGINNFFKEASLEFNSNLE